MALAACAIWPRRAARSGRHARRAASAADSSATLPRARPAGAPMVLALTATHPSSAALGLALGASLLDRAAVARLARAAAQRPLRLQRRGRLHGRAHAAGRAARAGAGRSRSIWPASSSPTGPLRRRLAVRLSVALRALGARGVVLDWRDLPPAARAQYAIFVHELRVELGPRAQIVVTVPPVRTMLALKHGRLRPARPRAARPGCWCWRGTSTGRAASPGPSPRSRSGSSTLRTVLRAAPRSRVLMGVPTWGWQWSASGRSRAGDAGRALPRRRRSWRSRGPTARASESARGSSPIARCSSSC